MKIKVWFVAFAVMVCAFFGGDARAAAELIMAYPVATGTTSMTVTGVAIPGDCDPCLIVVGFADESDLGRQISTVSWNAETFTIGNLATAGASTPKGTAQHAWLFDPTPGVTADLTVTTGSGSDAGINVTVWKGAASGTAESNLIAGVTAKDVSVSVTSTEGSLILVAVSEGQGNANQGPLPPQRLTALEGYISAGSDSGRFGYAFGRASGVTSLTWGWNTTTSARLAMSTVAFDVASPTPEAALDLGDPTDAISSVITDTGWVNMATEHSLLCDGSDEVAKYAAAIEANSTSSAKNLNRAALLVPDGDCATSGPVNFRRADGTWLHQAAIIGQGRTNTTIRLLDGSSGYNDPLIPKPILQANSRFTSGVGDPAWNVSGGGNEAFNNYLYNLTIDMGDNNSGAAGADWHISNSGAIRGVKIIGGAQGCYAGIMNRRELAGPGLVADSEIVGCQYAYVHNQPQYCMGFERTTISAQTVAGFLINSAGLCLRGITSVNSVPLVNSSSSSGLTTVLDSTHTGGAGGSAFTGTGTLFLRNVNLDGFSAVVNGVSGISNEAVTPSIAEYHSRATETAFNLFSPNSIGVSSPVPPTMFTTDNPAATLNAHFYGLSSGGTDDAPGFQKAMNEGYPYVYATWDGFSLDTTLSIPATVLTWDGMLGNISPEGDGTNPAILVEEDSATPLTIWRIRGSTNTPPSTSILITAQRPVVLKDINLGGPSQVVIGENAGPVWIENMFTGRLVIKEGAIVHASQLDVERSNWDNVTYDGMTFVRSPRIINDGGTLDVQCLKTESARPVSLTREGGTTESIGGFIYPVSTLPLDTPSIAANESIDSFVFMSYIEECVIDSGRCYPVHMRETRNGAVKEVVRADLPARGGGALGRHATALSAHWTDDIVVNPTETFENADSKSWLVTAIDPDGENGIVLDPGIWSQPVDCSPYARVAMSVEAPGGGIDVDLFSCNDIDGAPIGSFDPAVPSTLENAHQCTNLTADVIADGVGTASGTAEPFHFSGHLGQLVAKIVSCDEDCAAIVSLSCSGSNANGVFEGDALSVKDAIGVLTNSINAALVDGMYVELLLQVPDTRREPLTVPDLGKVKVYRPDYDSDRDGPTIVTP